MKQEKELFEQLESLYDIWEETQARIRSRLDEIMEECQHVDRKWQKRLQLMDQSTAFLRRVLPPDP